MHKPYYTSSSSSPNIYKYNTNQAPKATTTYSPYYHNDHIYSNNNHTNNNDNDDDRKYPKPPQYYKQYQHRRRQYEQQEEDYPYDDNDNDHELDNNYEEEENICDNSVNDLNSNDNPMYYHNNDYGDNDESIMTHNDYESQRYESNHPTNRQDYRHHDHYQQPHQYKHHHQDYPLPPSGIKRRDGKASPNKHEQHYLDQPYRHNQPHPCTQPHHHTQQYHPGSSQAYIQDHKQQYTPYSNPVYHGNTDEEAPEYNDYDEENGDGYSDNREEDHPQHHHHDGNNEEEEEQMLEEHNSIGNPTSNPTGHPTSTPTGHSTSNPTDHPTSNPTGHPTSNPNPDSGYNDKDDLSNSMRINIANGIPISSIENSLIMSSNNYSQYQPKQQNVSLMSSIGSDWQCYVEKAYREQGRMQDQQEKRQTQEQVKCNVKKSNAIAVENKIGNKKNRPVEHQEKSYMMANDSKHMNQVSSTATPNTISTVDINKRLLKYGNTSSRKQDLYVPYGSSSHNSTKASYYYTEPSSKPYDPSHHTHHQGPIHKTYHGLTDGDSHLHHDEDEAEASLKGKAVDQYYLKDNAWNPISQKRNSTNQVANRSKSPYSSKTQHSGHSGYNTRTTQESQHDLNDENETQRVIAEVGESQFQRSQQDNDPVTSRKSGNKQGSKPPKAYPLNTHNQFSPIKNLIKPRNPYTTTTTTTTLAPTTTTNTLTSPPSQFQSTRSIIHIPISTPITFTPINLPIYTYLPTNPIIPTATTTATTTILPSSQAYHELPSNVYYYPTTTSTTNPSSSSFSSIQPEYLSNLYMNMTQSPSNHYQQPTRYQNIVMGNTNIMPSTIGGFVNTHQAQSQPQIQNIQKALHQPQTQQLQGINQPQPQLQAINQSQSQLQAVHQSQPQLQAIHQSQPQLQAIHQSQSQLQSIHQSQPQLQSLHQPQPQPQQFQSIHQSQPQLLSIHQSQPQLQQLEAILQGGLTSPPQHQHQQQQQQPLTTNPTSAGTITQTTHITHNDKLFLPQRLPSTQYQNLLSQAQAQAQAQDNNNNNSNTSNELPGKFFANTPTNEPYFRSISPGFNPEKYLREQEDALKRFDDESNKFRQKKKILEMINTTNNKTSMETNTSNINNTSNFTYYTTSHNQNSKHESSSSAESTQPTHHTAQLVHYPAEQNPHFPSTYYPSNITTQGLGQGQRQGQGLEQGQGQGQGQGQDQGQGQGQAQGLGQGQGQVQGPGYNRNLEANDKSMVQSTRQSHPQQVKEYFKYKVDIDFELPKQIIGIESQSSIGMNNVGYAQNPNLNPNLNLNSKPETKTKAVLVEKNPPLFSSSSLGENKYMNEGNNQELNFSFKPQGLDVMSNRENREDNKSPVKMIIDMTSPKTKSTKPSKLSKPSKPTTINKQAHTQIEKPKPRQQLQQSQQSQQSQQPQQQTIVKTPPNIEQPNNTQEPILKHKSHEVIIVTDDLNQDATPLAEFFQKRKRDLIDRLENQRHASVNRREAAQKSSNQDLSKEELLRRRKEFRAPSPMKGSPSDGLNGINNDPNGPKDISSGPSGPSGGPNVLIGGPGDASPNPNPLGTSHPTSPPKQAILSNHPNLMRSPQVNKPRLNQLQPLEQEANKDFKPREQLVLPERLIERLASGAARKMDKKEMKEMNVRVYANLPEVKKKQEEEKRKEDIKKRMVKVKELDEKIRSKSKKR